MAKSLKVGIIGVGGIARTHIPGWNASPPLTWSLAVISVKMSLNSGAKQTTSRNWRPTQLTSQRCGY